MRKLLVILLPLMLLACQPKDHAINGYVEGEFVMISSTSSGLLEDLFVDRGQNVAVGDQLFSLDAAELMARRDSAMAELSGARAAVEDLTKGERPEELEIILKQKEQAQATLTNAQKEYERVLPLSKKGAASLSDRDDAKAALDEAKARLEELNAKIKAANLGARIDQIAAAQADVDKAKQSLVQAEKKLADAAPLAPSNGYIQDTFYRPGEYVSAGQPVVSLLPPDNIKIRFFVPQSRVSSLKSGQAVMVDCDGCSGTMPAKITYVSSEAEYTPPIIYSVESRAKLVFLVEAKPDSFHSELRPGLPVDISLGQ